eukprot:7412777-Alexandrium_andersonii.AAC.1
MTDWREVIGHEGGRFGLGRTLFLHVPACFTAFWRLLPGSWQPFCRPWLTAHTAIIVRCEGTFQRTYT